ncbi:MAG: amidohydrolase family protein [Gemmatimonadaceae bacterium]
MFGSACARPPVSTSVSPRTTASDTAEARLVFEGNIDAIHKRDRARYLSYYLQTATLARNGPGGLDLGFADWPARRDSTWPDTLVARDLRLVPVAPGIVYGTYHYRVTQAGSATEGISERLFVRTTEGWKIAVSTAFGFPTGAAPPPVALVGGTLINPDAAPVPSAVVVVRSGRIVCAAAASECVPPPYAETVRVDGGFISPGLVDAHVHYSQTGWVDGRPDAIDVRAEYPYDSIVADLQRRPDRYDRAYLCSGVTAVFDVGGYPWTHPLSRAHEVSLSAPHVSAAGPLLSSIDHWVNLPALRQFVHMRSDSVVRAAVRAQAAMGAAAVKVWYLQLPDSLQARARELLLVAGAEAAKARLPLIVHATQLARAKDALRAGATVLVHSVAPEDVDDEFIELARNNKVIVIPTLTVLEGYADVYLGRSPAHRYPLECVDKQTLAKLERVLPEDRRRSGIARVRSGRMDSSFAATERNIRRMRASGLAIAMGTDAGNPGTAAGPSVYREMEAMQAAGMPAREVFASSTIIAARAMGRQSDIGSLEKGKIADLVVFDADPTADIANARRVRLVMRGGALYNRAELLPQR